MRTVFDKEPAHFSCADESSPRKFMDFVCRYNPALQVGHLRESFSKLNVILKTNKTQTKGYRSPPLSSRCSCYEKQLTQVGANYLSSCRFIYREVLGQIVMSVLCGRFSCFLLSTPIPSASRGWDHLRKFFFLRGYQ